MTGNPLLGLGQEPTFAIKRRWDDDVVFKNQVGAKVVVGRQESPGQEPPLVLF